MRRFLLRSALCLSLACAPLGFAGIEAYAAAEFKGKGESSIVAELPNQGEIQLNIQDIVLHADFENYVEAEEGALPLYASDFFELHYEIVKYIEEEFSKEEIEATAAYIYTARNKGFEKRLTLSEEDKNKVISEIEEKSYDAGDIAFDELPKLVEMYLVKREILSSAKTEMVNDLYEKLDVIGFIKLDQESRECKLEDSKANAKCRDVKEQLLKVLDKDDYKAACRTDAVNFMSAHYDSKSIDFARNYHDVVDLKTIKFIVDDGDYNREKLREYMDGALMELYKRGYHPKDEKNMEISRALHPTIMRRCVGLLGQFK